MSALCDTTNWLPTPMWSNTLGEIDDREYRDFDAQSERLTTHSQEYVQLSDGPFLGRFISCALGTDVSVHIEHANQALSQSVAGATDSYALGVVLSAGHVFRANGKAVDCDTLFIVPPKTDLHLYSPHHGTVMACTVAPRLLDAKLEYAPHLRDRLHAAHNAVVCLHAPAVAERLRRDAHRALTLNAQGVTNPLDKTVMGETLVDNLVATLMLSSPSDSHQLNSGHPASFRHFLAAKARLDLSDPLTHTLPEMSQDLSLSKRTLQYAFTREVSLGISGYQRRLRLHAVRRALQAGDSTTHSIGDLAAQHGFWNWSHFSQQYRRLFGERPSDTASQSRTSR